MTMRSRALRHAGVMLAGALAAAFPASVLAQDGPVATDNRFAPPNGAAVAALTGSDPRSLFPARAYDVGGSITDLMAGDVDDDNVLDLVATSDDAGALSVLLGLGDGFFADEVTVPFAPAVDAAAMGDLNGDGHPDVVTASRADATYTVLLGQGDGTFAVQPPGNQAGVWDVALFDLDGDSQLDLCMVLAGGDRVRVLRGDGDGTFSSGANYDVGDAPRQVAVGDLSGDGRPELAVISEFSEELHVLVNQGDGTFAAATAFALNTIADAVAIGDADGDGQSDVIVGAGEELRIYVGNGDGTVQSPPVVHALVRAVLAIAVTDVDGGGTLDLVLGTEDGLTVLRGATGGGLDPPEFFSAGESADRLVVEDLDGDGSLDVAVATSLTTLRVVAVLGGLGDGTFGGREEPFGVPEAADFVLADLDEDGALDAVAAHYGFGAFDQLTVQLGSGILDLGPPEIVSVDGVSRLEAADLQGDGHVDIVASTPLNVMHGAGDGSLQYIQTLDNGHSVGALAIADLNGDEVLDLVSLDGANDQIVTWPGLGDGSFQVGPVIFAPDNMRDIAVADFDGDGDRDLAVLFHNAGQQLSVYPGVGDGLFEPPLTHTAPLWGRRLALGDVDASGTLDLVATHTGAQPQISVHLGNGDGTFAAFQSFPTSPVPIEIALADMTGDGIPDVVTEHQHGGVGVMEGNGDGTYQTPALYVSGAESAGLTVLDLDGDGDQDLVVGNVESSALTVHLNTSSPFVDLGASLTGTGGAPRLVPMGTLIGGEVVTLTLGDALPGGTAFFIMGFSTLNAPFKGGTLVPALDILVPLPIDAEGSLVVPLPWPTGIPAGVVVYFQYWIPDPQGTAGFAASNALAGTTP